MCVCMYACIFSWLTIGSTQQTTQLSYEEDHIYSFNELFSPSMVVVHPRVKDLLLKPQISNMRSLFKLLFRAAQKPIAVAQCFPKEVECKLLLLMLP